MLAEVEDAGKEYGPEVARQGVDEAAALLKQFVAKVYRRMVDVDRRLRGQGYPQNVEPYDASAKVADMGRHIDERAQAIRDQIKVPRWFGGVAATVERHPVLVGAMVTIAAAILVWFLSG